MICNRFRRCWRLFKLIRRCCVRMTLRFGSLSLYLRSSWRASPQCALPCSSPHYDGEGVEEQGRKDKPRRCRRPSYKMGLLHPCGKVLEQVKDGRAVLIAGGHHHGDQQDGDGKQGNPRTQPDSDSFSITFVHSFLSLCNTFKCIDIAHSSHYNMDNIRRLG